MRSQAVFLCRWLDDIATLRLLYVTVQNMRYIQHRERGHRAGISELEEIVLVVGHERAHGRMLPRST